MSDVIDTIDGRVQGPIICKHVKKTIVPSVAAGTSALLVGENPSRRGFVIWNNSSNSCYISCDTVSIAASCTWILATFQAKEVLSIAYTGPLSAIRNSGTGTWTVWEFLA